MRPDYYADLARQYGTYCRDHGSNKLYRIACGPNVDDYDWTEALMKAVGDLGCGCVPKTTSRRSPSTTTAFAQPPEWAFTDLPGAKGSATQFSIEDYYQTVMNAQRMDELITRHSTIMDCYDPSRRIGLVVDEWGTWFDVEPGTNPGLPVPAEHAPRRLGRRPALRHLPPPRATAGDGQPRPDRQRAPGGAAHRRGAPDPHPDYHVFEMNKRHHDATRLDVHFASPVDVRPVGDFTCGRSA